MSIHHLELHIERQPDDFTCGPTCLHSLYSYHERPMPLEQVIREIPQLEWGGTLGVQLALHALARGFAATILTYNVQVFDPTWFFPGAPDLSDRLLQQKQAKEDLRLRTATDFYLQFLNLGGQVRYQDLTPSLIRRYLHGGLPILTGLSATYLYRTAREFGERCDPDDIRGEPAGHFVVLCGYHQTRREVLVADPLRGNPYSPDLKYWVSMDRLIASILLGIITYDANLLILEPKADS